MSQVWARLEIKQKHGIIINDGRSYTCRIAIEGDDKLREAIRAKLICGSTELCEKKNDILERQQRLHASLSANCGTVHYPIHRLIQLIEGEGYIWKCCPAAPDREVHLFCKTISALS